MKNKKENEHVEGVTLYSDLYSENKKSLHKKMFIELREGTRFVVFTHQTFHSFPKQR